MINILPDFALESTFVFFSLSQFLSIFLKKGKGTRNNFSRKMVKYLFLHKNTYFPKKIFLLKITRNVDFFEVFGSHVIKIPNEELTL